MTALTILLSGASRILQALAKDDLLGKSCTLTVLARQLNKCRES